MKNKRSRAEIQTDRIIELIEKGYEGYFYVNRPLIKYCLYLYYYGHIKKNNGIITRKIGLHQSEIANILNYENEKYIYSLLNLGKQYMEKAISNGYEKRIDEKITDKEIKNYLENRKKRVVNEEAEKNKSAEKEKVIEAVIRERIGVFHCLSYINELLIRIYYNIEPGEYENYAPDKIEKEFGIKKNSIRNRIHCSYRMLKDISYKENHQPLEDTKQIAIYAKNNIPRKRKI